MAEQQGQGDFWAGIVIGAVVGGVVGTVIGLSLAPRAGEASPKGKPRRTVAVEPDAEAEADEDKLMQVRRSLETKITELNDAIQDTRSQLLASNSDVTSNRNS
ncbi:MAG: hypothetical protein OHK0012_27730 [Synechococcales cyanobacterium]